MNGKTVLRQAQDERGSVAMHREAGEALRGGHEFEAVDVEVRRQGGTPVDGAGDIFQPENRRSVRQFKFGFVDKDAAGHDRPKAGNSHGCVKPGFPHGIVHIYSGFSAEQRGNVH